MAINGIDLEYIIWCEAMHFLYALAYSLVVAVPISTIWWITRHETFSDLQGGQSGQYYHLNRAAYNNLYQQNQAVKTTDSPTFANVTATGDLTSTDDVIVGDELRLTKDTEGVIKARDVLRFKDSDSIGEAQYIDILTAIHTIVASTQHQDAILNINRGADSNDWGHYLQFNRYTGVAAATPNWIIGRDGDEEPLYFFHYDGSTYSTVMAFNVDKSITIANALGSGLHTITGTNNATTNAQLTLSKVSYGTITFNQWYNSASDYGLNIGGAVGEGFNLNKYNGYCGINTTALSTFPLFVNGVTGTTATVVGTSAASDTLQMSHDASEYTDVAAYEKMKIIRIRRDIIGSMRVKYDQDSVAGTGTAYLRFYINGVAVGTEYGTTSTDAVTRSEDITYNARIGDTLEIWGKTSGTRPSYVSNFRIYFTDTAPTTAYDTS